MVAMMEDGLGFLGNKNIYINEKNNYTADYIGHHFLL